MYGGPAPEKTPKEEETSPVKSHSKPRREKGTGADKHQHQARTRDVRPSEERCSTRRHGAAKRSKTHGWANGK